MNEKSAAWNKYNGGHFILSNDIFEIRSIGNTDRRPERGILVNFKDFDGFGGFWRFLYFSSNWIKTYSKAK